MNNNSMTRRHALKIMGGGVLGSATMAVGFKDATAQPNTGLTADITGLLDDVLAGATTLQVLAFTNQGGALTAVGQILNAAGDLLDTFSSAVTSLQAECTILELELGPLYLNLLGLVIEIPDPIVLTITAVQGGGLLGDLLCAVANLLSGGGPLQQLVGLLNRILRNLGG